MPHAGVLLTDKPLGLSSRQVLNRLKAILGRTKAGHTGTLDPLATGMLPVCVGEATKFSQFLLDARKCYRTTLQLGVATDTGDAEGQVIAEHSVPNLSQHQRLQLLQAFSGELQQVPPMYSALKHQGQPLYKLAREGKEIERKPRSVLISRLAMLAYDETAHQLQLEVTCSKGTYIRSLAMDIGDYLGCGAHLTALHRTWVHPYQQITMHTLDQLLSDDDWQQHLLPIDSMLHHIPALNCTTLQTRRLIHGQKLPLSQPLAPGLMRLYNDAGKFFGIGEVRVEGQGVCLKAKRLSAFPAGP